jgi:hypothetical protein
MHADCHADGSCAGHGGGDYGDRGAALERDCKVLFGY